MAKIISLKIDVSEAIKLFMSGYESAFIEMTEFEELEEILNLYKINLNGEH